MKEVATWSFGYLSLVGIYRIKIYRDGNVNKSLYASLFFPSLFSPFLTSKGLGS